MEMSGVHGIDRASGCTNRKLPGRQVVHVCTFQNCASQPGRHPELQTQPMQTGGGVGLSTLFEGMDLENIDKRLLAHINAQNAEIEGLNGLKRRGSRKAWLKYKC